jgi:mRNA-degrading endonuclease RelE of RelBE toxin-antitoxin system
VAAAVEFHPDVYKQLSSFPRKIQRQLLAKITALGENPRPHNAEQLEDETVRLYRIRSGDYRIIYHVEEGHPPTVLVVKVADRKEAYRRLGELVSYIKRQRGTR